MATSVRVRLDYEKAVIKMIAHTQLEVDVRAKACAKEPWTVAFIENMKRGDVLWDVGANVGSYSLIAAALGHDVVAIEPGLANFKALIDNAQLNRSQGRIYAMQVVLGATTEKVSFLQHSMPGLAADGGLLAMECQQI